MCINKSLKGLIGFDALIVLGQFFARLNFRQFKQKLLIIFIISREKSEN